MQAAAHVAEQAGEKADHGPRHAGHLDQQAEEHEERHGQQDQMAHAFVHATNDDRIGRVRRQRQISDGGKTEGKGDRHRRQHHGADDDHEEDQQVEIAERFQYRRDEDERGDDAGDERPSREQAAQARDAGEPQDRRDQHQSDANG
ncbi:hypothetical protein ABH975_005536 [Bradyrhizobium ottawaense]